MSLEEEKVALHLERKPSEQCESSPKNLKKLSAKYLRKEGKLLKPMKADRASLKKFDDYIKAVDSLHSDFEQDE